MIITRTRNTLLLFALALTPALALPANAQATHQAAVYTGGTATLAPATSGTLDTASPQALIFHAPAASIEIPYADMQSYAYTTEAARHLGVLPAIAVGLVKRRERRHIITITYTGPGQAPQFAVFEVPKHDPPTLMAILHARAPHPGSRTF